MERVETIAIGGAPIYGTDAIAGTVNIILRDDFEGFEFSVTKGVSPEFNDGDESRYELTWGRDYAGGQGNFAVTGMYTSIEGLLKSDRPVVINSPNFESPIDPESPYDFVPYDDLKVGIDDLDPYGLIFGNQFFFNTFGNGLPMDATDPNSPFVQFDPAGEIFPFVVGEATGSPIWRNGGDGLDLDALAPLNTDQERYNLTFLSHYELTDTIKFRGELWWNHAESTQLIAQPQFNGPAFGGLPQDSWQSVGEGAIPVLLNNPFLPSTTRDALTTTLNRVQDFNGDGLAEPTIDTDGDGVPDAVGFWRGGSTYRLTGNTPRTTESDLYRLALALDGELDLGGNDFLWDVSFTLGRSENDSKRQGFNSPHFEKSVRVIPDANGNPVCQDASGGCVPLNVIGTPSTEAIEYVTDLITDNTVIDQRVLSANISGDLFDLPADTVAFAAGFAYREESVDFTPNHLAQQGLDRFNPEPLHGEFDSTEFYAEAVVPLLGGNMGIPLVDTLEFEGAFRFVDNSVGGQDTTWTAGMRYRPFESLEIRGNVTEAIRAPSLLELFQPVSEINSFATDPCDERFIAAGDNPDARSANCAADGIVQPFNSIVVNASQPGTLSGNPDLDNEVADSSTIGFIYRPGFLPNLTASVDWYDIEVNEAISNFTLSNILSACYDSDDFSSEELCDRFQRNGGGQIVDYQTGYVNIARLQVRGVQSVVSWFTSLGRFGDLGLNFNHLYTEKSQFTPGVGNTIDNSGTVGNAEHRVNLSATWHYGDWSWYNQLRWLDSGPWTNEPTVYSTSGVGSWTNWNTTLGYTLNENIDLQLTVENLLDREPPTIAAASDRVIRTYYSSILGRYARLTLNARF